MVNHAGPTWLLFMVNWLAKKMSDGCMYLQYCFWHHSILILKLRKCILDEQTVRSVKTLWDMRFEEWLPVAWCSVAVYPSVDTGADTVQHFYCDQGECKLRTLVHDAKLREIISILNNWASVQRDLETLADWTLRLSVRCVKLGT